MKKLKTICLVFLLTINVVSAQNKIIKPNNADLQYQGRIIFKADSVGLSWTGSSVKIAFKGTRIKTWLRDEHGKNFIKVLLDGKPVNDIHLDSFKHEYTLVSGLSNTKHTIELFKRTEWIFGKTWFYGFELNKGTLAQLPQKAKLRMEFYGNSITCGYGVVDSSGKDRGTPEYEDGYYSYAAITARYFKARYSCIARSGIGLMVSWFPQVMPELYDRLNPEDKNSKWDFAQYAPNLIVINLGQNDSWILKQPGNPQFKTRFGDTPPTERQIIDAYKSFIIKIRHANPFSHILCVLGNMDIVKTGSPWPSYIQTAVQELKDKEIDCHFFNYKNTPGHPKLSEQQAMANDLIDYLQKNTGWTADFPQMVIGG